MPHRYYNEVEQPTEGCIESSYAKDKDGYSLMWSGNKYVKHHRHVYCRANNVTRDSIAGKVVMHICDNPSCVNPEHLRLGTFFTNMVDKTMKGRNHAPTGEAHGMAKLTTELVLEIRSKSIRGCTALANEYGIAHQTVSKILRRVSWKHI